MKETQKIEINIEHEIQEIYQSQILCTIMDTLLILSTLQYIRTIYTEVNSTTWTTFRGSINYFITTAMPICDPIGYNSIW